VILVGDCRDSLRSLADSSVHCVVTSPPYYGLRDYGHAGQIGLEQTPEDYVAELVAVFREVRRVLRDDGTLWLNLGDSYAGSGRGGDPQHPSTTLQGSTRSQAAASVKRSRNDVSSAQRKHCPTVRGSRLPPGFHSEPFEAGVLGRAWVPPPVGLKQKDLIGIPWMVAFALRADGWYLRQEIIWHKPNPMPESVRDRCTKAHEQIFLLSKSRRYYFDAEAIAEPLASSSIDRLSQATLAEQRGSDRVPGKTNGTMKAVARSGNKQRKPGSERGCPEGTGSNVHGSVPWEGTSRNKRSVWTVTTKPFKGAHFATFPADLIEPCVLAGTPAGGTVLDPFGGAGTTAIVADALGRKYVLCELNPEYAALARERYAAEPAPAPALELHDLRTVPA